MKKVHIVVSVVDGSDPDGVDNFGDIVGVFKKKEDADAEISRLNDLMENGDIEEDVDFNTENVKLFTRVEHFLR
jgi:hypothetical protein